MVDYKWSQRKEEQLLCALVHAAGPIGLMALVSSLIVFSSHRNKSAFISIQALQALLFQGLSMFLAGVSFVFVMAGFQFTMMSGMVAQTGVTNPRLTNQLILAGIIGVGMVHFFLWVFPLVGVYASMRVLLGRNFRYPILGPLAARWAKPSGNGDPMRSSPIAIQSAPSSDSSSLLPAIANLLAVIGLAAVVNPIIWSLNSNARKIDRFALLQAAVYDILLKAAIYILFFSFFAMVVIFGLIESSLDPFIAELFYFPRSQELPGYVFISLIVFTFLVGRGIPLVGAIAEILGRTYRFPLISSRVEGYLGRNTV